jgi:hypothetical protein
MLVHALQSHLTLGLVPVNDTATRNFATRVGVINRASGNESSQLSDKAIFSGESSARGDVVSHRTGIIDLKACIVGFSAVSMPLESKSLLAGSAVRDQSVVVRSDSNVPGTGTALPCAVAHVPEYFRGGRVFRPGDCLVAKFTDASGNHGLGQNIVRLDPDGTETTVYCSSQSGLTGLGFLKAGFVLVGNVPNVGGTPQAGGIQILNADGQLVGTIKDSNLLAGPWYLSVVNDTGCTAQVFVSNVLLGTVTRLHVLIQNGRVTLLDMVQIASGYSHYLDAARFVIGPAGLVYDPVRCVLYVASPADNAVYAIANPTAATSDRGTGRLVVDDVHLRAPVRVVVAPNGNLLVAMSDSQCDLCEFTPQGMYVAKVPVCMANGALGL